MTVPDYESMSSTECAEHRAQFRVRFNILRDAYPHLDVPKDIDNIPLEQMHRQYEHFVRMIHVEQDIEQYKVYLLILWLFLEFIFVKLGFRLGGYVKEQLKSIHKYQKYLCEISLNKQFGLTSVASLSSNLYLLAIIVYISMKEAVKMIWDNMTKSISY